MKLVALLVATVAVAGFAAAEARPTRSGAEYLGAPALMEASPSRARLGRPS